MFGRNAPGKNRAEIYALDIIKAQLQAWSRFASLVTGVCVLTGEVDGPALFDAVQAGNFWQWVVRPGGD